MWRLNKKLPKYEISVQGEIHHIDGCKTNNSVANLEWVTQSENIKHAFKTGVMKSNLLDYNIQRAKIAKAFQ